MNEFIVTCGFILLAVLIVGTYILGDSSDSLKGATTTVMNKQIERMQTIP